MIDNRTHSLITSLVDTCFGEYHLEREFRQRLIDADQDTRSEIAYALHDMLITHRDCPPDVTISLERVEKYISTRIKIAEWHANRDDLYDDLDDIMAEIEEYGSFFDEGDDSVI